MNVLANWLKHILIFEYTEIILKTYKTHIQIYSVPVRKAIVNPAYKRIYNKQTEQGQRR